MLRPRYYADHGMDRTLEQCLPYDGGFYVELGANDGVTGSNTLHFEQERGWRGVLVEPSPNNFLQCVKNRSARNAIFCAACVSFDYTGEFVKIAYSNLMSAAFGLESDVPDPAAHALSGRRILHDREVPFIYGAPAVTLNQLLLGAGAPRQIDLLSLDVEGAELEVLKGIDHGQYRFHYMLVESRDAPKLQAFLAAQHYAVVARLSGLDYLFRDTTMSA